MIWRLVGYTDAGEEVNAIDLSADLITDGNLLIICPLERTMLMAEAEALRAALRRFGIRAIVSSEPIQVWKVKLPE